MRARATATMASASRAKAVRMAIWMTAGRRRYSRQYRTEASAYRATPATAMTASGPRLASSGRGASSGGSPNSDTTAQATINASSPPRSRAWRRSTASARSGVRSMEETAANTAASSRPTGVAMAKPALRPVSSTWGVARACSSRNPALDRNTSETRNRRASARRRDTSLMRRPRATLTAATATTSPKWMPWCSRTTSKWGWASSSHSPSRGSTRWKNQTATRSVARRGMAAATVSRPAPGGPAPPPRGRRGRAGRRRPRRSGRG